MSAASDPEMESSMDPHVSTILRCLAPEEIDMLRDAFIFMDRDSDGFVAMDEMLDKVKLSVPAERFVPLREYLTPLFLVADKDGDGKLSLTEFLMSFADGPGVVPADVVNNCVAAVRVRLTDEEISALQENFRIIDTNGDGFLDVEELEVALRSHLSPKFPDLTDGQYAEIITVIMSSADADGDGRLCLSEFIRSFQEDQGVLPASLVDTSFAGPDGNRSATPVARELTDAEAATLSEAFAVLDTNNDGYVDFADLYSALSESLASQVEDRSQIKDLTDLIMATADRRNSGRLSLREFMLGFLRNMEVMQIAVAVAQEKVRTACARLQQMHESGELERLVTVFEDLDKNGDGFIDRAEMVGLLTSLFKDAFPEWDDETLGSVMTAIVAGAETQGAGKISLQNFVRSFVDGPGMLPPEAVRKLVDRATASRSGGARPGTASDDDLTRIGEALRDLNESADAGGCVTEANLKAAIDAAFSDQLAAHPSKADAMFRYVLSRFVNVLGAGRLAWNENVQIEEVDVDGEEAQAAAGGPIHVPTAQDQEKVSACAEDDETKVEFTNRDGGEDEGDQTPSRRPRRRIISVTAVEVDLERPNRDDGDAATDSPAAAAGTAAGGRPTGPASPYALGYAADVREDSANRRAADGTLVAMVPSIVAVAKAAPRPGGKTATQLLDAYQYAANTATGRNAGKGLDDGLRQLFRQYDTVKLGYLDREQFKKIYCSMEHYGLEPSQAEIDRQFTKYANNSDKVFFDEFCVLMLQRVQL